MVICGSPAIPSRGSVDVRVGTSPFSLGSEVTYRCDEGLFPPDVKTSTCTDVDGRGEWVENPESLVCRGRPGSYSLHQFFYSFFAVSISERTALYLPYYWCAM